MSYIPEPGFDDRFGGGIEYEDEFDHDHKLGEVQVDKEPLEHTTMDSHKDISIHQAKEHPLVENTPASKGAWVPDDDGDLDEIDFEDDEDLASPTAQTDREKASDYTSLEFATPDSLKRRRSFGIESPVQPENYLREFF